MRRGGRWAVRALGELATVAAVPLVLVAVAVAPRKGPEEPPSLFEDPAHRAICKACQDIAAQRAAQIDPDPDAFDDEEGYRFVEETPAEAAAQVEQIRTAAATRGGMTRLEQPAGPDSQAVSFEGLRAARGPVRIDDHL